MIYAAFFPDVIVDSYLVGTFTERMNLSENQNEYHRLMSPSLVACVIFGIVTLLA